MYKGKRNHGIVGIRVNGEPMLTWYDRVCALLDELLSKCGSSVSPGDRFDGKEELAPL